MSNVLERFRSVSGLEFYRIARDTYVDMQTFLLNEHHVPRKYWDTNVYPLLDKFHRLFDLIEEADNVPVYNKDPEKLALKESVQSECIRQLHRIYFDYRLLIEAVWRNHLDPSNTTREAVKARNRINDWCARLEREEKLLIGWKNGASKRKRNR